MMYENNNNNKHLFQNKPLKQWDSNDISNWLTSIGMKLCISTFKSENITGKQLRKFTEDDLRTKCKITARPIRKILFKRLKHVQGKWNKDGSDEEDEEIEKKEEKDDEQNSLLKDSDKDVSHENHIDTNEKETSQSNDLNDSERILTRKEAAFIIESMYHCWKARQIVLSLIQHQYIKVYSLQTGRYVYKFIGRDVKSKDTGEMYKVFSTLAPTEPLVRKPINLGSADLPVLFTISLAIARIQLFARYCHTIRKVRSLVRQQWRKMTDNVSGKEFFFHPPSGCKRWTKPKLLGNERWNPMDMRLWNVEDVQLYFRKLRVDMPSIIRAIQQHKINGPLLLLFEGEDLDRLGIPNNELKRKVLYDIELVVKKHKSHLFKLDLVRKRDRFRYNYQIVQAAIIIQRKIRQFIVKSKFSKLNDILVRRRKEFLLQNQTWWSHYRFQLVTVFKEFSGEPQKLTIPF